MSECCGGCGKDPLMKKAEASANEANKTDSQKSVDKASTDKAVLTGIWQPANKQYVSEYKACYIQ